VAGFGGVNFDLGRKPESLQGAEIVRTDPRDRCGSGVAGSPRSPQARSMPILPLEDIAPRHVRLIRSSDVPDSGMNLKPVPHASWSPGYHQVALWVQCYPAHSDLGLV
jgi:hypothetical protein